MTRNESSRSPLREYCRAIGITIVLGVTAACGSDRATATSHDPAHLYWSLVASDRAAVMAVGQTLHLSATPRYYSGEAIPDLPAVSFQSQDPGKVSVDSDGTVHALDLTGGVQVVASLQSQGITHTDTTMVAVTPAATTIATFSIHPVPPDSAVLPTGSLLFINPIIRDVDGNDVFGIPVSIQTSDTVHVSMGFGLVFTQGAGLVSVIATTNAYGARLKDSVVYRITYPPMGSVTVDSATSAFNPSGVKIAAVGTVTWFNASLTPASVTFDDPTNVAGGNIVTIAPGESVSRQFPVAGTYTYHGSTPNLSGQVIVF